MNIHKQNNNYYVLIKMHRFTFFYSYVSNCAVANCPSVRISYSISFPNREAFRFWATHSASCHSRSASPKLFDTAHDENPVSNASDCPSGIPPIPLCHKLHLPCTHNSAREIRNISPRPRCLLHAPHDVFCRRYSSSPRNSAYPLLSSCDEDCTNCNVSYWLLLLPFAAAERVILSVHSTPVPLVPIPQPLKCT